MIRDEHRKTQYSIPCHITKRTEVIINAESDEEALRKFYALDWVDEYPFGEIVDVTHDGKPKVLKSALRST